MATSTNTLSYTAVTGDVICLAGGAFIVSVVLTDTSDGTTIGKTVYIDSAGHATDEKGRVLGTLSGAQLTALAASRTNADAGVQALAGANKFKP